MAGATDSKEGGDEDGADILGNICNSTNHNTTIEDVRLLQGLEDSLEAPDDPLDGEDEDYQAEEEDDEDEDFVVATQSLTSSSTRKRRQPPSRKTAGATKKKQTTTKRNQQKKTTTPSRRTTKRRRKSEDHDYDDGTKDEDYVDKLQNKVADDDGLDDEYQQETHTTSPTTAAVNTSNRPSGKPKGPRTCGGRGPAVGRLPALWREVLRRLPPVPPDSDGYVGLPYDPDAIQRLVLDLALDPSLHGQVGGQEKVGDDYVAGSGDVITISNEAEAERRVVAEALKRVVTSTSEGGRRYRLPQRDGYDRSAVLALYEAFLSSPKQQKKRSYRMEGALDLRSLWTEERIARFQLAFRKFGYGPTSNRKIAEAIGEGIHANHVADFKRRYKKVLIKEGRIDELKSISGIRMKKIEQKMNQLRDKQQQKKGRRTPAASKRAAAEAAASAPTGVFENSDACEAVATPNDIDASAPA